MRHSGKLGKRGARSRRGEGPEGRMASGDNSEGQWASHGCHRSPDWLSDAFNTAAKPSNMGCLLPRVVCVCVCGVVCVV